MDKRKRCCIFIVFVIAVLAAGLIIAALATTFWIEAYPYRNINETIKLEAVKVSGKYDKDKFQGTMHFGLFYGKKQLNYGFGSEGREKEMWIAEGIQEFGLFDFGLWVSTLIFAALAIAWAIVVMAFTILNLNTRPIETITGPMGLYIWNTLAGICSLISVILFVVMNEKYIKVNVLTQAEKDNYWVSTDRTYLSYSFWFMVCSIPCFFLNLGFVYASGTRLRPIKYNSSMNKAPMDGVMMY
ncbi:clarin-1-like [Tubulanus polymorphus]|uniref:clarin-1-like n=1 Tax=Tubulanus polymorphus TaxID=672921 RepID=UPI003DA36EB6